MSLKIGASGDWTLCGEGWEDGNCVAVRILSLRVPHNKIMAASNFRVVKPRLGRPEYTWIVLRCNDNWTKDRGLVGSLASAAGESGVEGMKSIEDG